MEITVNSLIDMAYEDIQSSKILYKKKKYPQALFLLQQAAEKGYKSIALITRQIELSQLRSVGHDYIKLLKKNLSSLPNIAKDKSTSLINSTTMFGQPVDMNLLSTEIADSKRDDFFELTDDEIKSYLKEIKSFKRRRKNLLNSHNIQNQIAEISKATGRLTQEEMESMDNDLLNGILESELEKIGAFLSHTFTLNIIGLITSPHSEQCRYPFGADNNLKCPVKIYTLDMPIIKHLGYLIKQAEDSIYNLKFES